MSHAQSGSVDLKTIGVIVGIVGALAGSIGSWYVNSYRLDQLESDAEEHDKEAVRKIAEVKCLVASVHDIPLPECK